MLVIEEYLGSRQSRAGFAFWVIGFGFWENKSIRSLLPEDFVKVKTINPTYNI
jgi:hypothetical protein